MGTVFFTMKEAEVLARVSDVYRRKHLALSRENLISVGFGRIYHLFAKLCVQDRTSATVTALRRGNVSLLAR